MNKLILGLGGLVLVAAVVFAVAQPEGTSAPEDLSGGSLDTVMRVGKNAIAVWTQAPGETVELSFVVLEHNGFVVLHEVTGEAPGQIVTASGLITSGNHENVSIELPETSTIGETYIAMLHADNGDGVFDVTTDAPVMDEIGVSPIMMQFEIGEESEGSEAAI